ncbi:Vacuolar protein sorting-associated protein 53-like [Hondaea fermentalgiana]|uniref:Vacuolar protein sorting-associated protein 53-like n=1 Tax=Hondaea fermentalgiana TaxID=2315210 RepID=A0A2R5GC32_9STRA|nr:Vacuolar protein sorting-associated protein 53-like [Hondaea fermentalgiana]|eukprot:GBG26143.1 Vacuolar protein sorting-associated protein 53-like [Hondaea fermentalgiana]
MATNDSDAEASTELAEPRDEPVEGEQPPVGDEQDVEEQQQAHEDQTPSVYSAKDDVGASEPTRYPEVVEQALKGCFGGEPQQRQPDGEAAGFMRRRSSQQSSSLLGDSGHGDHEFDALDDADFDPVAFVNDRFPDEKSFALLDPFLSRLRSQVGTLDVAVFEAVKAQSTQAERSIGDIIEAKESIKQLQTKVKEIKGKAEQSEVMVQEICRDIKKLDNAKRHLTHTITSLKKFHMLVTAVDQLDFMVESRQYRETANLLQAIAQLLAAFEQHKTIEPVAKLRDSVARTRAGLTEQIFHDFEALSEVSADYSSKDSRTSRPTASSADADGGSSGLYEDPHAPPAHTYEDPFAPPVTPDNADALFYSSDAHTPESLAGACAVVDALGSSIRRQLIERVCQVWLGPYDRLFGPGEEHSGLEFTERRYAWLRRLLRHNEERYDTIFPHAWNINKHLVFAFVQRTEGHLRAELRSIDPPESADVSALVRALRKTLDFEHEMAVRFEYDRNKPSDEAQLAHDTSAALTSESIRRKHAVRRAESTGQQTVTSEDADAIAEMESGAIVGDELRAVREQAIAEANELPPIRGAVSETFEPYLIAYVKAVASKMREELQKVVREENVDADGSLPYFSSASQMFALIKSGINQCIQFTTGQAFYDLHVEFKKIMTEYARTLESKLPAVGKGLSPASARMACHVLNSAEYCAETVEQLEALIQGKIDEDFREKISLEDEVDTFFGTVDKASKALVGGVIAIIEPNLIEASRTNWSTFSDFTDQSKYVSTLDVVLGEFIPLLRGLLSAVYFRRFCDSFAARFIKRYSDFVANCRKVSESAAQQLLLDAQAVKSLLGKVPDLAERAAPSDSEDGDLSFVTYKKMVEPQMQRLEAILKLAGMDLQPTLLIENFKLLLADGTTEDLRQVLELKGYQKPEQGKLLKEAEQAGIPKATAVPGTPLSGAAASPASGSFKTAGAGAAFPSFASTVKGGDDDTSFTQVFSKMTDMGKEHLDKVTAAAASSSSGRSFGSFSANLSSSLQQSYQRAVKKANR